MIGYPSRQDCTILSARDYPLCFARKIFPKAILISGNPLLTKLVLSRWLDIGSSVLFNFCMSMDRLTWVPEVSLVWFRCPLCLYCDLHFAARVHPCPNITRKNLWYPGYGAVHSVSIHKHTKIELGQYSATLIDLMMGQ